MADDEHYMDIDEAESLQSINHEIAHFRRDGTPGQHDLDERSVYTLLRGSTAHADITGAAIAVLDTNFLLSHLGYIDALVSAAAASPGSLVVVVPWTVVTELDGLKRPSADPSSLTPGLARTAIRFLEARLRAHCPTLRGQRKWETPNPVDKTTGDDSILDCCLYFASQGAPQVTLLSNDRNLAVKAMIHDIVSLSAESTMERQQFLKTLPRQQLTHVTTDDAMDMEIVSTEPVTVDIDMVDSSSSSMTAAKQRRQQPVDDKTPRSRWAAPHPEGQPYPNSSALAYHHELDEFLLSSTHSSHQRENPSSHSH